MAMSHDNGKQTEGTVEIFTKSSLSGGGGNCVEVAQVNGGMAVRDSKDPDGPVLWFTRDEWVAFQGGMLAGEFDLK
jgi:hypothetical protein